MIGAIAGDVIGSVYEAVNNKSLFFPLFSPYSRFTDDTVLTVATAQAILKERPYLDCIREFGRKYPNAGFGGHFYDWLFAANPLPYNSWGNGSAMRVSPVGFAFDDMGKVLEEAKKSAEVSHNHPEGIKGAQAVACAVFLARKGAGKEAVREEIAARFGYNMDRTVDEIRPSYAFDVSCQGSVPEAIIAFLDSENFEDAIRQAVSLGGDSDTIGCMAGAIAQAYYKGVPGEIAAEVRSRLPEEFLNIIDEFNKVYGLS
ncbi:ADP-ribosylglycohydrolase [Desulfatibacillum alkenivorans DSM 16219]|jgi:ADP-ribosylglycohydrolase|uniref:ADP-ribosylglycohydrolase n=1 Tax=Desulfatibacillum alkenivorans DSM 16219 TaxID=1121393 RepID=A0A1M6VK86_9BACT|nr:ADP-ribosylglycohydrolase family protein [Desulfatibacillum alkenivorans]SHK81771.1 ADP-ribosylglycohydrolase [Desulfatibacillum alkenivorans DSM 16219]